MRLRVTEEIYSVCRVFSMGRGVSSRGMGRWLSLRLAMLGGLARTSVAECLLAITRHLLGVDIQ